MTQRLGGRTVIACRPTVSTMSFEWHSDVCERPPFNELSLAAFGLRVMAGTWTSRNATGGFVPDAAAAELGDHPNIVAELVTAGVWSRVDGGYRMEFGPSADWPLPVWRYGTEQPKNGWFELLAEPDA